MRQMLVFPNGFSVDISSMPTTQDVNTVYDAGWVLDKQIALQQWVIYAIIHQECANEETIMIYLEEANISKNFKFGKEG